MSDLGANLKDASFDMQALAPIQKEFYAEADSVKNRTDREIQEIRDKLSLSVTGRDFRRPITTFEEAGFPEYLERELLKMNFAAPTPIQAQAWPLVMSGCDVVGVAETGSGKTIAFALPAMYVDPVSLLYDPED